MGEFLANRLIIESNKGSIEPFLLVQVKINGQFPHFEERLEIAVQVE